MKKERYYEEDGKCWYESTLIKFAKNKKNITTYNKLFILNEFEDLKINWKIDNIRDFMFHEKRVNYVNTNYPIILTPEGNIADGMHRLVKALIYKELYIKFEVYDDEILPAVQLKKMPKHDFEI